MQNFISFIKQFETEILSLIFTICILLLTNNYYDLKHLTYHYFLIVADEIKESEKQVYVLKEQVDVSKEQIKKLKEQDTKTKAFLHP